MQAFQTLHDQIKPMKPWQSMRAHQLASHLCVGLLLTLAPFVMNDAHAAGFDCRQAKTNVEKLICTNPQLSQLDDQMKVLYDSLEDETAGHDGETGDLIDPVGDDLVKWRATVRDKCEDAACLKSAYTTQMAAMKKKWADALPPGQQ